MWFDPWVNNQSLINLFGWNNLYVFGGANKKVSSIIENYKCKTKNHHAAYIFKSAICKIEIDKSLKENNWFWKLSYKGKFSFKNTWDYIEGNENEVN